MTLGNMRARFCNTALACLLIVLATPRLLNAQQPTLLNFACEGELTDGSTGDKGESVNIGLVVNLVEKTVSFAGYVARFQKVDAANIYFHGESQQHGIYETIDGNVDRVTGAANATVVITTKFTIRNDWKVLCKPTTRLF